MRLYEVTAPLKKKKPAPPPVLTAPKNKIVDKKLETASLGSYIESVARQNGINGVHLANFLAQCKVETGNWASLKEWSDGWQYDPSTNPVGAKKLGNLYKGDGPRYKGRGFIHLTGRWNYEQCGKAIGADLVNHPELVETDTKIAGQSTLWFWNRFIRTNYKANDIHGVSARVNGPNPNGLAERIKAFNAYVTVLLAPLNKMNPANKYKKAEADPTDMDTQVAATDTGTDPEQTVA